MLGFRVSIPLRNTRRVAKHYALYMLGAAQRIWPRHNASTRILLAADDNPMLAHYALLYFEQAEKADDAIVALVAEPPHMPPSILERARCSGVQLVPRRASTWKRWDIVVFPAHQPLRYPPQSVSVHVGHGHGYARMIKQQPFRFDPSRVLTPTGKRVYYRLAETSGGMALEAVRRVPEYRGMVRVVGSPEADRFAAVGAERRKQDRDARGVSSPFHLLVTSSWGASAVLPRFADRLLPWLIELAEENVLRVTVTAHVNLWKGRGVGVAGISEMLAAFQGANRVVLGPGEDVLGTVAEVDAAIVDNSSLATMLAVAGVALIPISLPDDAALPGSYAAALRKKVPTAADFVSLQDLVLRCRRGDRPAAPSPPFDHLGNSRKLVGQLFEELYGESSRRRGRWL